MKPNQDQIIEYVTSFDTPVESDFFGAKQNEKIEKEKTKLKKTLDYIDAVTKNPSLGAQMEKDIVTGLIYSQGEITKVRNRLRALEQTGDRFFPDISLVSPTGQRIIMSRRFSDALGHMTDGYFKADELDLAIITLKAEGVLDDQLAKLRKAMSEHGAIIVQRGAYESLLDLLDEAAGYDIKRSQFVKKDKEFEQVKETFENQKDHGLSLEALKAAIEIPMPPKAVPLENTPFARELKREMDTAELRQPTKDEMGPQAPAVPKAPTVSRPMPPLKPMSDIATKFAPLPKALQVPMAPKHYPQTVPTGGLASLMDIKTVDDFKKIQPDHLRQGELRSQIELLQAKLVSVAQANKLIPYYTVNAFEQSPLYKSYLAIGAALITDTNPDRSQAFENAVKKAAGEKITLREFEAIADLRKQIEQL
ncbi:MAG: hypothetical protein KW788_03320 [Candidatus Doudnabacteria bacterium]|nr:hypothetical protein [Candidatus Doudnabacteria bacterium]